MARKKTQFDESAYLNDVNYIRYFNTLKKENTDVQYAKLAIGN